VTGMPKAVVADPQGWEASAAERPFFSEEQGLAFLCKTTKQRFRPTMSPPANTGFETAWGEEEAAAGPEFQSAALPRSAMNPAELARLAAAAFKEPLSSALGAPRLAATAPLFPSRDSRPRLDQERPRPRTEWVTFSESTMAAPVLPGTAPGRLTTGGSQDSLGKREPSVPRSAGALDGWGMRQHQWDEEQCQQPQQHRPQQFAASSSSLPFETGRDEGDQEAFHDVACQLFLAPSRSSSPLPNSFGLGTSNGWAEDRQPPRELPPWPAWGGNLQQQPRQQQPWT